MHWLKKNPTFVLVAVLAVIAVYYLKKADKFVDKATEPAGELLSDLWAAALGRSGIELQPLMIRDTYLDDNFKLTREAADTLYSIQAYKPLLDEVFDAYGVLKPEYRNKLNVRLGID
ncbi:hypothetical protein AAOGI_06760 [Agarivorans albus]